MSLSAFYQELQERAAQVKIAYPTRRVIQEFLRQTFHFLFSSYYQPLAHPSFEDFTRDLKKLKTELQELLEPFLDLSRSNTSASQIADHFFEESLYELNQILTQDAEAAYAGDPAAESIQEVILAYPGFFGIATHRLAHYFFQLKIPIFPRLLAEFAHEKTGIDIHPGAKIGNAFFMDHGTGIVIGGTSVIADNVKIYQGVTLGALSVNKDAASTKRHPTIEKNVVIYAGATILGGETVIGHDSIIGGNSWITDSVQPYSIVYHKSEVRVRSSKQIEGVIDFSI